MYYLRERSKELHCIEIAPLEKLAAHFTVQWQTTPQDFSAKTENFYQSMPTRNPFIAKTKIIQFWHEQTQLELRKNWNSTEGDSIISKMFHELWACLNTEITEENLTRHQPKRSKIFQTVHRKKTTTLLKI